MDLTKDGLKKIMALESHSNLPSLISSGDFSQKLDSIRNKTSDLENQILDVVLSIQTENIEYKISKCQLPMLNSGVFLDEDIIIRSKVKEDDWNVEIQVSDNRLLKLFDMLNADAYTIVCKVYG